MAITRQQNWLGQQRCDVPHLRAVESGVVYDFDLLAGQIMAGGRPLVVRGFELLTSGVSKASDLKLRVADAILLHPLASENGTVFTIANDTADVALDGVSSQVVGAFSPGQTNYVGVDLIRQADDSTADVVAFRNESGVESYREVPLARTVTYRVVISPLDFSATPGVAAISKVTVDASGNVTSTEDARDLMCRLGTGGGAPNPTRTYEWPGGRAESGLTGGDKSIESLKAWMDAVMTRLWELGGGERWFSASAERNVHFTTVGTTFANGSFFEWNGTNLHWRGLSFIFENSSAYYNDIKDQLVDSTGLTNLADGECLYVDIDRTANRTGGTALQPVKASLTLLGTPAIPGSRYVIAWRKGAEVYTRGIRVKVSAP